MQDKKRWKDKIPSIPKSTRVDLSPKPSEVRIARLTAGLTKADAARLVFVNPQTWEHWENASYGIKMHPAIAELFALKTGLKPLEPFVPDYTLGLDGWDKLPKE